MTDWIWEEAMLDADFALKLEKIQRFNAIEKYIPLLVKKLYIHRYVYENEILMPKRTKDQIAKLIELDKAFIVDANSLRHDTYQSLIYIQTIQQLEKMDPETRINGKNWGETVTIAFAFAKGIPFILSDERELQELINHQLNSGTCTDITVIRLRRFVEGMKERGLSRKEAYAIWCFAHSDERDKAKLDKAKRAFQNDIWRL